MIGSSALPADTERPARQLQYTRLKDFHKLYPAMLALDTEAP